MNKTLDSNGPDVKVRGTASHICEKYQSLARDANASGDKVMAENYLQHAEHYYRLMVAAQPQNQGANQSAGHTGGYHGQNGAGQPAQGQANGSGQPRADVNGANGAHVDAVSEGSDQPSDGALGALKEDTVNPPPRERRQRGRRPGRARPDQGEVQPAGEKRAARGEG
ncbi:MAG: DUF4167 domain-containing protein, partial [Pseudomonadota bacterium]